MANADVHRSSTFAPVNIAVIKYWGKRDTALNLPTNSSLSITLSQDDLRTHTTASCSLKYTRDALVLNGEDQDISGARTQACLRELRGLRKEVEAKDGSVPELSGMALKIVSENNFPTAAGLASSAAGFAALVRAIADLYALPSPPAELSRIARQGSGSACRSLFGGYVAWKMGEETDGSDSAAYEVAPAQHWPDMRALILVASAEKKDVSSTVGMQATVKTSELFAHRAENIVPARMAATEECVKSRDFATFADLTMRDSNNFHATCLDTSPPIFYMNDTSRAAVRVCEAINTHAGRTICAYTFDAGPNAVVYYLAETEAQVAGAFRGIVGHKTGWDNSRGRAIQAGEVPKGMEIAAEMLENGVSRVILTAVGDGPRRTEEHLC
ncbi:diphosphomevalonate decarboxylase [Friedmanniomyces endolithicus]|uniref:Diphosphomevalonate decarboxylase n=1 Tax=Friedmanniomyces endolithicus TaxID=329885 RepID=A0AAN6JH07_9PEZI|nr:diphosphomevalonate decarboxylase [Friedmanniomyces endolithicus]KAK0268964.1 diphosphomevalonate decarboxylase [Friedmanniomyces endolithicus]KAK0324095.1 diphosphomevalonate decarboxylase [Friedmanniomyces endolithicus]KAK0981660.1 diphosphomevalonate decarboxylase [Friedmanniomyces endolithicus]KAK1023315.1 diphosphomevalonate decarboxylase [Friedmanniomyces endolithicus]